MKELFYQYRYKQFQHHLQSLNTENLINKYIADLEKYPYKFIEQHDQQVRGLLSFTPFSTLSKILKQRIFFLNHFLIDDRYSTYQQLFLVAFQKFSQEIDFLISRQPINNVKAVNSLLKNGFYYVCGESIFTLNLAKYQIPEIKDQGCISLAQQEDLAEIKSIAKFNHKHNRYLNDSFFDKKNIHQLFEKTLEYSFAHPDHNICVYKKNKQIVGYISFIHNKNLSQDIGNATYGSLDYIVIDERFQNNNIGYALNNYALQQLKAKKVNIISVKTMANNYPAIRLLLKNHFVITSQNVILHYLKKK